jgi:xanthine dehydrogenase YagS FAD-binding subunit
MRPSEAALLGKAPDRAAFERAAERSVDGARPLSGNRYKLELLPRTVVRALEMAAEVV